MFVHGTPVAGAWEPAETQDLRPVSSELSSAKHRPWRWKSLPWFTVHSGIRQACWGFMHIRNKNETSAPQTGQPPLKLVLHTCRLVDWGLGVPVWVRGAPMHPRCPLTSGHSLEGTCLGGATVGLGTQE